MFLSNRQFECCARSMWINFSQSLALLGANMEKKAPCRNFFPTLADISDMLTCVESTHSSESAMATYMHWNMYATAVLALRQQSLKSDTIRDPRVGRKRKIVEDDPLWRPPPSKETRLEHNPLDLLANPKSAQITFRPHSDVNFPSNHQPETLAISSLRGGRRVSRKRNLTDHQHKPEEDERISPGNALSRVNPGRTLIQKPVEEEPIGRTNASHLLPEILSEIFEYLDLPSKGRAAQVCRKWREAADKKSVWKGIEAKIHMKRYQGPMFSSFMRKGITQVQVLSLKKSIKEVTNGVPNLVSLNLSGCYNLTDYTLGMTFIKSFPYLESLNLSFCKEVSDASIARIAHHCPSLRSLELAGCTRITDAALGVIGQGLKTLKRLNLRSCRLLTDIGIVNMTSESPSTVPAQGSQCQIEELVLQDCQRITDESLRQLSLGLPSLKKINLSFCVSVTDTGLKSLSRLRSLEALNLRSCDNVSDIGLAYLAETGPSMLALDVSFCTGVSDAGVRHIANHMTNLKDLSISNCAITDKCLIKLASSLLALEVLNMGQCKNVTVKSLEVVAEKLKALRKIDLYGCANASKEVIEKISKLPKMQDLNTGLYMS